ncbi:MAG: FmdB family transcriptional regulator [Acidimicrobiia bacterium]|nr:FmdB family transcriptional regulator [Acidimicrobiia bacterium]
MPTYEYECAKCGDHLEVYQSFTDEPLKRHKGCNGKLSKVFGTPGIVLKGSGFYKTDHGSASKKAAKVGATSDAAASTDSGSSDKSSSDKSAGTKSSSDKGSPDKTSPNGKSSGAKEAGSKGSAKAGAGT